MTKDSLGDRIKAYENIERRYLPFRAPVIIRVDGVHFHSFTKGFPSPYYGLFRQAMEETAKKLCENIAGCKIAYTQSDEISLLVTDDDDINTQPWFGKNLQKLVSVTASMATLFFRETVEQFLQNDLALRVHTSPDKSLEEIVANEPLYNAIFNKHKTAMFDARAFCVPREEVLNVFVWRQQDCLRNAVESAGRAEFSHKQLEGKSCADIVAMLKNEKNIDFDAYVPSFRKGVCVKKMPCEITSKTGETMIRKKFVVCHDVPIFNVEPRYIEDAVYHRGE